MKSIIIIFLFFCLISKRGAADQEYQQIDLYAETSFLKENKKHRVKKLNLEQKKELAKIINKYNLFRDGKTETDVPFIGNLGIFHIIINKKPYLLFMAYNTKHIHLFDKKKLEVKNIRRSSFGYKKGTTRVV
ncbi:hypothetical protein C1I94_01310 [Akkermansia muciniphila]|jgi:hypothetical protein|uniref:hypothetical protein n=1 Tax=Akkermansia muciniphila TaxID=239935 RepID=UPI000F0B63EE|nr:hypothetical protein [Akkermansia muciniphila]AYR34074.1 hypothetical protein CUC06_00945 [Akkermansia muciniphila]MCL6666298.1 hypothetical protein [Akkermansia muciniphila]MCP2374345.1 hypothetical protein [Akkermansia muciniphila]QAA40374.1 hypothetical protein C1I94_01310 [Akkermansia muciniphila]QAA42707.1 hypothetical protein C1I96_01275 [Akkermansia muciniphila]